MLKLSSKWAKILLSQPETGMGYQVVSIILKNGIRYEQVIIVGGIITQIGSKKDIPFNEDDIMKIIVNQ